MGFDLFPSSMASVMKSEHPKTLKFFRIGALVLNIIGMVILMDRDGYTEFDSSIFSIKIEIGVFYYFFAVLPYFSIDYNDYIDKLACILFVLSWALILPISLLDPAFVLFANSISPTGAIFTINTLDLCFRYILPVVLLIIDYILNRICFIREQYILAIAGCIALVFSAKIPSESVLETFMSEVFLPLRISVLIFGVIFLEIGRAVKAKFCGSSELGNHLL